MIRARRKEGFSIVSLEIASRSVPITDHRPEGPVCIVVGHEILGVSAEIQAESDAIVHIPMLGKKQSLNVSVAAGIALFHYRDGI